MVFGTLTNPPAVDEVLTALEKPDVQTVVCLAAVRVEERKDFVDKLLVPLRGLRARTGRPHWILVDEAHDLLPASGREEDSPSEGAENTLYATDDPASLSPAILAEVDGIAACGVGAKALIESFASALSWDARTMPASDAREGEALVWFRHAEHPVALVGIEGMRNDAQPAIKAEKRENSPEVGQVLRRA